MTICSRQKKILIIKFGGLGDIFLSLNAIFSILKHHKTKTILLTEKPYDKFFYTSGWFDKIVTIKRGLFYFFDKKQIQKKIVNEKFEFVYDLQTSRRTSSYLEFFLDMNSTTNGIGKFAKLNHNSKYRNQMHTHERQKEQISLNGVRYIENIDLKWVYKSTFIPPKKKFILVVPGGSLKRKNKRIPTKIFERLISFFLIDKFEVLLIGGKDDVDTCRKIKSKFPSVVNLCNQTTINDLGKLSKYSTLSIGNDTGPMHVIAKGGNLTFVFFTKYSNPDLCKPVGKKVFIFNYENDQRKFYNNVKKTIQIKV